MWGVSQPRECDDMQRVDWSVCTCLRHEDKFRLGSVFRSARPSQERRLAAAQSGGGGSDRLLAHARAQVPVHHQLQVSSDSLVRLCISGGGGGCRPPT